MRTHVFPQPKAPDGPSPSHTLAQPGLLQRWSTTQPASVAMPPSVQAVLHTSGQVLEPSTRALMELRFRHDFSQVRVHTDVKAAEAAEIVNAKAYTVGRDIVFGPGQMAWSVAWPPLSCMLPRPSGGEYARQG